MNNTQHRARLWQLMWWSLRLNWSRNKIQRRRARHEIRVMLEARWCYLLPDTVPGSASGVIHAVWLGAALAARSMARSPRLSTHLTIPVVFAMRLLGRKNMKALLAAYLAWVWLWDVARGVKAGTRTLQNQG